MNWEEEQTAEYPPWTWEEAAERAWGKTDESKEGDDE